jgi:transposase InsO family protein
MRGTSWGSRRAGARELGRPPTASGAPAASWGLAIVEWVAWFNDQRLHEYLGDIPPDEFEALYTLSTELRKATATEAETN